MTEETSSTSSSENSNEFIELDIPIFIELKQSGSANDLGAFSRIEVSADQFLGSYKGKHRKSIGQCADPNYVWTILSSRQMPLFYIDASDPSDSNWLRFIKSTPDPTKYNVICMQQNQQINYFTFKGIKEGEELLTFLPGRKKKPRNKAYANLSYKLYDETYDETETVEYPEEKNPQDEQQQDTVECPEEEEASALDDVVELKLMDDVKKKEDYFFSIGFSLKLKNTKKSVRRQLIKCDLCSYAFVIDCRCDYDRIIKSHVIEKHLSRADESKSTEQVIGDVCESIIRQIENPVSVENTFDYYFKFDSNRNKHDLLNSSLKCFYCSYESECDQESVACFFKHLVKWHQDEMKKDQLLSEIDESKLIEHDLGLVNWSDYFRLSFKDNRFPSDKSKSSKTWTCHLCKKQFEQRVDLSKHKCIELNLKLLKKKKELRKKRWRETHWKRKIDLSYIETTSLSQISANVCDNLTFCVDGTRHDLKSYAKEVNNYLNSHLNKEIQIQMVLKCCFPNLYSQIVKQIVNLNESNAAKLIQEYLINAASNYFTDNLICRQCKEQFASLSNYVHHEKFVHDTVRIKKGPVGYLSCDLIGYLLNLYWDTTVHGKHVNTCPKTEAICLEENKEKEGFVIADQIVNDLVEGIRIEMGRGQKKRMASESLDDEMNKKRAVGNDDSETKAVRRSTRASIGASSIELQSYVELAEKDETKVQSARVNSRGRHKADQTDTLSESLPVKKETKGEFMSVKIVNNKKVHTCDKCDLEFTSSNSVTRHQEKSCLRVKVISCESKSKARSKTGEIKKKCPICGYVFSNTHQLSIHIYRQHKSLLGSASTPPSDEAVRLNQLQVNKSLDQTEVVSDFENEQD